MTGRKSGRGRRSCGTAMGRLYHRSVGNHIPLLHDGCRRSCRTSRMGRRHMTGRTADAGRYGTVSAGRGLEGGRDPTSGCRGGTICLGMAGLRLTCGLCIGAHTLIALLCGGRIRLGIGLGTIAGLLRSCLIGLCAGLNGLTGLLGRGGTYLRLGLTGRGMAVEDSSGTAAAGAVVPGGYWTAAWSSAAAAARTLTSYRTGCCLGHMG